MPNHEQEIFNIARQMTCSKERNTYLDRICANDDELRRRLDTLLAAYEEAPDFLESGPPISGLARDHNVPPIVEGELIDDFRLIELLGEGGFASVFAPSNYDRFAVKSRLRY